MKTLMVRFVMLSVGVSSLWLSQSARAGYSDAVLRNKPVGYWRLGEGDVADPLKDSSGNGNDGIYNTFDKDPPGLEVGQEGAIVGDPDTSVKIGNALGFGEGDNGQGQITPGGSLDIGTVGNISGTAEAWFQILPTTNASWSYPRIFHYNNFGNGQFSFGLVGNDSGGGQFPARTVYAAVGAGGGGGGVLKNALPDLMPATEDPEWHHLVATYDAETIGLYLDGEELTDLVDGDPASWQNAQATIGGRTNGASSHVQPFPGYLDELAVYNRVLSAAEIKLHYEIGIGAKKLSDLNSDKAVDAADAGIMFGVWATDSASGDINLDGIVDAADAGIMFGEWTGDPSTPGANAATAEYNKETGELKVSSAGAVNLFVQSAGSHITPLSPAPAVPVGLLTNNASRVGITNLGPINVTNFSFGNIGVGLAQSDLKLVYTPALGQKGIEVAAGTDAFKYIPEPASLGMLGLGLAGLLASRRRSA